jgi:hypothetical protein
VGLLTYPLTLVPAAQMIEHYIIAHCGGARSRGYTAIAEPASDLSPSHTAAHTSLAMRGANRLVLVAATTFVAVALPCFGTVHCSVQPLFTQPTC